MPAIEGKLDETRICHAPSVMIHLLVYPLRQFPTSSAEVDIVISVADLIVIEPQSQISLHETCTLDYCPQPRTKHLLI